MGKEFFIKIKRIGLLLILSSLIFSVLETLYFQSSYLPESRNELFCDLFSSVLLGGGLSLFVISNIVKYK
jgi:hypothetical protein